MSIDWTWNPVVFIIVLVVSIALASYSTKKNAPVAWLLPAFVLWFGLDWALSSPWSTIVTWLFWLAVIAVIATAIMPRATKFARVPFGIMTVVIALGLMGNAVTWVNNDNSPTPPSSETENNSSSEATEGDNETDYVIDMPKRTGNRLNADGVPKEIRGDAEKFRQFILDQAQRDPLTLFNYYMASPLGKRDPLENEAVLAKDGNVKDGNVYSEAGIEAYERWSIIWGNPDITSVKAVREITHQGVNTGVTDKNKSTQDSSGVRGKDKSGYDVAYKGATGKVVGEQSALDRCTQSTMDTPHEDVPEGPTDNPPPKKKTPPPGGEEPPPGLTPKSGDARDYPYPSGKGTNTASPRGESRPPRVETNRGGGGGGVSDSPGRKPNSETGVTAPGATSPRPTSPTQPPEGGNGGNNTNDGEVGGF